MKLFSNKRGFIAGPLGNTVVTIFGLFLIGILLFAFALAGAQMLTSTTDATAKAVISNTTNGALGLAKFTPTLWIIAGVAALIALVIGSIAIYFVAGRR